MRKFLLFLPLLLLGLGVECFKKERTEKCVYCESRQESEEVKWWVLGWAGRNEAIGEIHETRFFKDYPEYTCNHQWNYEEGFVTHYWNSPILSHPISHSKFHTSRSAIVARYQTDKIFRRSLRELEEDGLVSRELVLKVAACHCMCGGRCQIPFDPASEGDSFRDLLGSL